MTAHEGFAELRARVQGWIEADPDPETRAEASALLAAAVGGDAVASETLADAFSGRLAFGTAGLRARLGAGPRRMNRVVVGQSSAGFAAYLRQRAARGECTDPPSVIVGFDARVNSEPFARETARVLAGAGLAVTLIPGPSPTPLTAFAVAQRGFSAGVMITASHNPPQDNGYKVYLGDADRGSQVTAPEDQRIAALIEAAARVPFAEIPRSDDYALAGGDLTDAYVAQTLESLPWSGSGSAAATAGFVAVYTAMHGVGSALTARIFAAAGLPEPHRVHEQDAPDGRFPTLPYPNPEEAGSLDLAFASARARGAHVVIAQDPDADRLAIAAPDPALGGEYRRLTGNELGLLLGWRAAEREVARAAAEGRAPCGALGNTLVSSPALRAVAETHGLAHHETLSGFKWVSRIPGLVFGFEESLGYLSNPQVLRDKDGISAALEAYAMVVELHGEGRTLWDRLDEASARFGHFASRQVVLRLDSSIEVSGITAGLRAEPPAEFAGVRVAELVDLSVPGAAAVPADVLCFGLEGGSRVMVRPSGTEPKLKVYLDFCAHEGSVDERRATAEAALQPLERAVRAAIDRVRGR